MIKAQTTRNKEQITRTKSYGAGKELPIWKQYQEEDEQSTNYKKKQMVKEKTIPKHTQRR